MLKDILAKVIGRSNYVNYVMYLTKVYHAFRTFRHPAAPLMRQRLIPKGGVVLDIGANIGKFTALAAKAVGSSGRVYSFEPVPFVLRVLKTMVRLRCFRQVRVIETALSDRNGSADIRIPLKDGWKPLVPIAHLGEAEESGVLNVTIELKRLDDFCVAERIDKIDFIKCDTEGSEFAVFTGARECLARHKPTVVSEIYHDYLARRNATPDMVFNLFLPLGYKAFLIHNNGMLAPTDRYISQADYLFIHPSRMDEKTLAPFLQEC
ncbi:MAG: FkbM family methyltransferase [Fibrobacterota bacterium]